MRLPLKSAAAALVIAMFQTAASAADLRAPYSPAQNDDVPVELGTGWYIRGDLAAAQDNSVQFGSNPKLQLLKPPNGWSAGLGAGYKFNNWFRADLTVDYRSPVQNQGLAGSNPCQIGATPVTGVTGTTQQPIIGRDAFGNSILLGFQTINVIGVVGSQPVNTTCTAYERDRLNRTHVLANGYLDLGTWSGFTPYLGAGIGVNVIYNKSQINWFMPNQNPYNVSWKDPFSNITFQGFRDTQHSGFTYRLAWALMGGVAFDLTPHLKLDIGYRYLSLGNYSALDSSGNPITKRLSAQEIRTGFRYVID
jgi:opacity protein-like surface antigen